MKTWVVGAALLGCSVVASADFALSSYDTQHSFMRAQAGARAAGDEQLIDPIAVPGTGTLNADVPANGGSAYAHVASNYSFGASGLQTSLTRFDRGGPSYVVLNGAWLFTVTDTVMSHASGHLNVANTVYTNDNSLSASLFDFTDGVWLFQSYQYDQAAAFSYELGGQVGSQQHSFSGSLDNLLQAGHTYRLLYAMGVYNGGADADDSTALGDITLSAAAVPEPASALLALAGLGGLAVARRRRRQA